MIFTYEVACIDRTPRCHMLYMIQIITRRWVDEDSMIDDDRWLGFKPNLACSRRDVPFHHHNTPSPAMLIHFEIVESRPI